MTFKLVDRNISDSSITKQTKLFNKFIENQVGIQSHYNTTSVDSFKLYDRLHLYYLLPELSAESYSVWVLFSPNSLKSTIEASIWNKLPASVDAVFFIISLQTGIQDNGQKNGVGKYTSYVTN